MKKILILLFFSQNLFSQILGGAGICYVNADPNTLTIATQNQSGCKRALNTTNGWTYYYDDTRAVNTRWVLEQKNIYEVRTLPIVVNDIVNIGDFTITNASSIIEIDLNLQGATFARSKKYIVTIDNNFSANTWFVVQPVSQTKIESVPVFQVNLIFQRFSSTIYRFALQRTEGSAAATAYINISIKGLAQGVSFGPLTSNVSIGLVNGTYSITGNISPNLHIFTTSFTVSTEHEILRCNPTALIIATMLPAATNANKKLTFVNFGTSAMALSLNFRVGGSSISNTISAGGRVTIVSDGNEWIQIQ